MMEKYELGALVCFDNDNIRYITNTNLHEWTRVYPETGNPRTRHLCTNPIIDFDDATHARWLEHRRSEESAL